jgi:hypothetical protein
MKKSDKVIFMSGARYYFLKRSGIVMLAAVVSVGVFGCSKQSAKTEGNIFEQLADTNATVMGSRATGTGTSNSAAAVLVKVEPKVALLALFDAINPEIRIRINLGESEIFTAVGARHQTKLYEITDLPGAADLVTVKPFTNAILLDSSSLLIGGHLFIDDLTDNVKRAPYVIYPKAALRK